MAAVEEYLVKSGKFEDIVEEKILPKGPEGFTKERKEKKAAYIEKIYEELKIT